MPIGSMYPLPKLPYKAAKLDCHFTVEGRHYQMSYGGRIRIQVGTRKPDGRIQYRELASSGHYDTLGQYVAVAVTWPNIKRLSYKPSEFAPYVELAKYEPKQG